MKITNPAIKTVKARLNNTAENVFTALILLSTVQTWQSTLLSSKFYVLGFKAL